MSEPKEAKQEENKFPWIIIVVLAIIFLLVYLFFKNKEVEDLKAKLKAQKDALESLSKDLEASQKLLTKVKKTIHNYKIALRITLVAAVAAIDWWFISRYYPVDLTLKDICEGIATSTGSLAILTSGGLFLRYGNFIDLKTAYESFQVLVLTIRFQKKDEVIEALIRLKTINRQTLMREIEETNKQIAALEVELNKPAQETPTPTMPGMPIVPPTVIFEQPIVPEFKKAEGSD